MSVITVQCQLKAPEESLHHLWSLMMEKNTLLVNELLNQINTHPNSDNWLQEGKITASVIEGLCKNLIAESPFQGMPARFATEQESLQAPKQEQDRISDKQKLRKGLIRKQNPVPYPISYESNTDWTWWRNKDKGKTDETNPDLQSLRNEDKGKRICVKFNGIRKHPFEIFCDQRQLHWFERFVEDDEIFNCEQNKNQVPAGLLTLRSVRLVWQEGEGKGEPWQVHRLLLHCSIETRLWTAEGTEEVRAEKIPATQKIIDGMKAKGSRSPKLKDYESSLERLQKFRGFSRPSRAGYKGNPSIVIGVSFGRDKPATVAVVNVETGAVLAYRDVQQLLSKPIKEGKTKKKKTQYEQLKRWREQQCLNSHERHKAQKKGARCNFGESKQGEYVDRLLAKAIVEVAKQYRASSIVLPNLRNIREATENEVRARAEQKFPGYKGLQDSYAKNYRASIHRWSYSRLAQCIELKAEKAGIATEKVHQPQGDSPQEKARNLVLAAYKNRKVSAS